MVESIKDVLMNRDNMTEEEANESIGYARECLYDAIANGDLAYAEDICASEFGLEPDYLMDLLM